MQRRLEGIAPTIWRYALVVNVDLSDGPIREAFFGEGFPRSHPFVADLQIADAGAQTAYAKSSRYGSEVFVLGDPRDGRDALAVMGGNLTTW